MDKDIDRAIDELLEREGGYVNHAADRGGATCFGITEAVARAHGYGGAMRQLPREKAKAIYRRLYWLRPRLDEIAKRSKRVARECFDTGVNMGPGVPVTFLQRGAHCAQSQRQRLPRPNARRTHRHPDTAALDRFLAVRGSGLGEIVLLRALEALQGER